MLRRNSVVVTCVPRDPDVSSCTKPANVFGCERRKNLIQCPIEFGMIEQDPILTEQCPDKDLRCREKFGWYIGRFKDHSFNSRRFGSCDSRIIHSVWVDLGEESYVILFIKLP